MLTDEQKAKLQKSIEDSHNRYVFAVDEKVKEFFLGRKSGLVLLAKEFGYEISYEYSWFFKQEADGSVLRTWKDTRLVARA